jgi:hypothetical protein
MKVGGVLDPSCDYPQTFQMIEMLDDISLQIENPDHDCDAGKIITSPGRPATDFREWR